MVKEATGQTFTFLEWAVASPPITLGMLLVGWLVMGHRLSRPPHAP